MKKKASILFVHGAGHAAWCWRDHFTGWFEARGYTVAAPDLPHHGDLNRRGIKFTPLSAYVDSVAQAAARLEPPLILIGHSMGGFIIQKYLERAEADLAVLVASTPPTGAFGMVKRMAMRRPVAFFNTMMTGNGTDSLAAPASPVPFFQHPVWPTVGAIWIRLFLLTHGYYALKHLIRRYNNTYWGILQSGNPGEQRWELLQRRWQEYDEALGRFYQKMEIRFPAVCYTTETDVPLKAQTAHHAQPS